MYHLFCELRGLGVAASLVILWELLMYSRVFINVLQSSVTFWEGWKERQEGKGKEKLDRQGLVPRVLL